jgi:hypothetical protein
VGRATEDVDVLEGVGQRRHRARRLGRRGVDPEDLATGDRPQFDDEERAEPFREPAAQGGDQRTDSRCEVLGVRDAQM